MGPNQTWNLGVLDDDVHNFTTFESSEGTLCADEFLQGNMALVTSEINIFMEIIMR